MSEGRSLKIRLGIVTTHPIQYQVPWFRALAAVPGIDLQVLYCMLPDERAQGDGFGVAFQWDLPLLDGYPYRLLENRARCPSVTRFDGCDTPELFRLVRDEPWDALIVNGWVAKSCVQALIACRLHRVPCLVRGESNALRPRVWWKRLIHRMLLAQYRAFLAIGSQNRAFYLANGVAVDRIFDAPYCVENERFVCPGRTPCVGRPFRFLFSGKLIPKKRPMDVLEAVARLAATDLAAGIELIVVGDGELRPDCEAFARERDLPVRFLGFLNQTSMAEAYGAADCLVLPSDNGETWGLVVNEAMASGMPAIVSDQVGCHPDLILEGCTGSVFPCGEVGLLADRMRAMAADPSRAHAMGQRALALVSGQYHYGRVVKGTLDALSAVTGKAIQ